MGICVDVVCVRSHIMYVFFMFITRERAPSLLTSLYNVEDNSMVHSRQIEYGHQGYVSMCVCVTRGCLLLLPCYSRTSGGSGVGPKRRGRGSSEVFPPSLGLFPQSRNPCNPVGSHRSRRIIGNSGETVVRVISSTYRTSFSFDEYRGRMMGTGVVCVCVGRRLLLDLDRTFYLHLLSH